VLAPYLKDPRIHYQFQENLGQSVARNTALESARGEFICFLDSDDTWLPHKLETQLAVVASHPEVDIVHGDEIFVDKNGAEIGRQNMARYSGNISVQMLRDNCVSIITTMTRRHCFDEMGGFSAKYGVADDYELWLRFSARYRFLYLRDFFARYRVMDDQISSDKSRRFKANELIIHDFLDAYPSVVSKKQAHSGLSAFYCRKARYFARDGQRGRAVAALTQAASYTPFSKTVWRAAFRVLVPDRY
jgi:glycosyltransferase involved in cell wall biosynthesis